MKIVRHVTALVVLAAATLAGPSAAAQSGASISGRVTAVDGSPLAGVCVQAFPQDASGNPADATTAADGRYRLDGLTAGSYAVAFNLCDDPLDGYAAEWWRDAVSPFDASVIVITAGEAETGVDAALAVAAVITGTVTERGGGALAGDCVVAFEDQTFAFGSTRTAADGSYTLGALPAGSYVVGFTDCSDPYHHISELYDGIQPERTPDTDPTLVTVAAGQTTAGVDAALELGGAIVGTLTAAHTGRPAALACAARFPVGDEFAAAIALAGIPPDTIDRDRPGRFVFGGVPAGTYEVEFASSACDDSGYEPRWWRTAATRSGATAVTVAPGATAGGISATLVPAPSIDVACPAPAEDGFRDVAATSPHETAIDCLAELGIALGTRPDRFSPGSAVRRDQMASFLARSLDSLGVDLPTTPPDAFRDDDGNPHELAINQLAALGVVAGVGPTSYGPSRVVNRAQMASFLVSAYEEATGIPLRSTGDRFSDDSGNTHQGNINRVATAAIATGTSPGRYRPGDAVQRAQMGSFLARLLDRALRDTAFDALAANANLPFGADVGQPVSAGTSIVSVPPP